jgi:hypothetical protein
VRLVNDDATVDLQPRGPRQGCVWLDAQSGDHPVNEELFPALRLEEVMSSSLLNPNNAHAFLHIQDLGT